MNCVTRGTLLAASYRGGELSHAYPLMRGCAPPLVALAGLFTGEHLGPAQWLALGLVCAGVLTIFVDSSRTARAARRTTILALCTACVIATCTLIDGAGVRRSYAAAGYTMWIFVATAVLVLALSWRREGRALLAFARRRPAILLGGGAMSAGSYGIALWAMTQAPVALVAALVLRERISPLRLLAVGLIACGAAAMRLA